MTDEHEFQADSENWARQVMALIDESLIDEFATVVAFLSDNPDFAAKPAARSGLIIGSRDYIKFWAVKYATARAPRYPSPPQTIPDEAASRVLHSYFNVAATDLDRVKREHLLSMAAENIVGDLLERFIASQIEEAGWAWCAGSFVSAIDFVRRDASDAWESLQIKNRDNSENSSSSRVRIGTPIKKWYRTVLRTGQTKWEAFPARTGASSLTENQFLEFIDDYFASQNIEMIEEL